MTTPNLGLPYMAGAQAQKHFWHDEALRHLDTLVQLAVLDRDLNAPPGLPADGERWIVKASPAPTGDWVGHGNHIAAWQDGAWQFSVPNTGWVAFVADEGTLLVWNGAAWGDFFSTVTAIQNLAQLGVGTTADATNPFSAKLNNVLWVAKTVAEGGDGHLRYKLSKESVGKTLSFLLQDNFSGRAEIGLIGDDNLSAKVSADGSAWTDAITVKTDGKVGIGVTNPLDPLHIGGTGGTYGRVSTTATDGSEFAGLTFRTPSAVFDFLVTGTGYGAGRSVQFYMAADSPLIFYNNGVERLRIDAGGATKPGADNAYDLGSAARRFATIYAATGAINTSDAREKTDIAACDLGLSFVLSLQPKSFRWIDGGQVAETLEHDSDGVAASVTDETGHPCRATIRMISRPGTRRHYGLIAQEVKAALDAAGVEDFAGWVLADKSDPESSQGLRMDQFIAPLVRAIQEQQAAMRALADRVASLEAG